MIVLKVKTAAKVVSDPNKGQRDFFPSKTHPPCSAARFGRVNGLPNGENLRRLYGDYEERYFDRRGKNENERQSRPW
jgi:hypothetical protein